MAPLDSVGDLADGSGVDEGVVHHQGEFAALGFFHQRQNLLRRAGQGFFHQHMFARPKGLRGQVKAD